MSKLKPVNDKIVVKPTPKEDEYKTESGIILADLVEGGSLSEGTVISVGSGMYSTTGALIPVSVEEGDTILYHQNSGGQEYKLNGEIVIIMSQNEVLSIVEE
tara:strand:- start:372 stop:677 length:306 start_codon:yes stop_codon:yes gene_type:complete